MFEDAERQAFLMSLIQKALMGALLIGVILFGRSLLKRTRAIFPEAEPDPTTAHFTELHGDDINQINDGDDYMLPELESEGQGDVLPELEEIEQRKNQLLAYVAKEPEKAAGLVRAWLLEK